MHALVLTFDLVDLTPQEYVDLCADLAPSFAALPGLLTKLWLDEPGGTGRAGFYLFTETADADAFLASTLARSVAENPHVAGLVVRRFEVDEATTALTQPGLAVVPATAPAR